MMKIIGLNHPIGMVCEHYSNILKFKENVFIMNLFVDPPTYADVLRVNGNHYDSEYQVLKIAPPGAI